MFGVAPWYWYLLILAQHLGLLLAFALVGIRRAPILGWIALVILLTHSAIPHKEARFVYPIIPLAITLAALGLVETADWIGNRWKIVLPAGGVAVACLGILTFHSVFFAPQFLYWSKSSGTLAAFDRLSRDPAVCGVGLFDTSWVEGSYAHLHHNVPTVLVPQAADLARLAPSFNALVRSGRGRLPDFQLSECRSGVCLYRRAGPCTPPPPEYELNTALRLSGN
jgi:hypothetical protein